MNSSIHLIIGEWPSKPISPALDRWRQKGSWGLLAVSLNQLLSSRFNERLCLKKSRWRTVKKRPTVNLGPYTYAQKLMNTSICTHTYIHTQMRLIINSKKKYSLHCITENVKFLGTLCQALGKVICV